MIKETLTKIPYTLVKVSRYPNNLFLINQGSDTVGQITIHDDFEEELWKEAIVEVNRLQKLKNNKT